MHPHSYLDPGDQVACQGWIERGTLFAAVVRKLLQETMLQSVAGGMSEGTTGYQSRDHAWLLSALSEAERLLRNGALADARARFSTFAVALERHIGLEEEVLLPLFEVKTGLVGGPTALMREEHREIANAVGRMREGLERGDSAAFDDGLGQFRQFFPAHASKEEHFLYPTLDRTLSAHELAVVLARLQRE
jgi:hemerythrin-like domain-containing protein